jgi:hypothetical protein
MFDLSAYPHILDGILGALVAEGSDSAHLRLRATTRALADHIDALFFKHISIHFTPSSALVCLPTGARLPLLPLRSDLERWRRALGFTRVADLHGSSALDLTSISIPLVRDLRDSGPCPFAAGEWHTFLWREERPCLLSPPVGARAVLHFPTLGGLDCAAFHDAPWDEVVAAWPAEGDVVLVLQDAAWQRPRNMADTFIDMGELADVLHRMLGEEGVTFVGWERLTADDTGRCDLRAPPGEAPFAIRAIRHAVKNLRPGDDAWESRVGWSSVDEWCQTSLSPDLALYSPRPPLE